MKILEHYKKLCADATSGPWDCHDLGPTLVGIPKQKDVPVTRWDDAQFIAESRTAMPRLVEALEKALEELKYLEEQYGPGGKMLTTIETILEGK